MDPFKNCKRFFSPHFWDRTHQRSISEEYVFIVIDKGTKTHVGDSNYEIKYKKWIIIVKKYKCRIVGKTAYHE